MKLRRKLMLATTLALTVAVNSSVHAQDNVIRVGTDATFPPMTFVANGKKTGFDIELVEALAKSMGKKVEWVDIDFKGLIPGLLSKRLDMAVSAIYITDERKKVVDFSDSYYPGGLVIMIKDSNTTIKSPSDLDGKKVSVQVGTKSVSYLQEHYPKVQRVEVEKNQEMFNLVEIGRVDAVVTGKPGVQQYMRTRPGMRMLKEQLTTEEYGFALRKDTPELTKAVNQALAKIKADGSYSSMVKKWFGDNIAK